MSPNLDNKEMLLVNRNAYAHFDLNRLINLIPGEDRHGTRELYPFHPPRRGDIIVLDPPVYPPSSKPYIKRIIGLPGERISFQGGYVYINGKKLNEPYIKGAITECGRTDHCALTIPQGSVFVLGDNRTNSSDSRVFGPVSIDHIVGKAWFAYWPTDDVGPVPHYSYPDD